MRRSLVVLLVAILLPAVSSAGKEKQPIFKSIEIKHFPQAEGVELPPEFSDFLYAELKTELKKSGLFEEIAGEGEVVEAADAPKSVVLEGNVLEYKKGSIVKQQLIGFGAGRRSLTAHIKVLRRSDNQPLIDQDLKVRAPAQFDPKHLARFLAGEISGNLKHQLKSKE